MLSGIGETAVLKGSPVGSLSEHDLSACAQHFFPVCWRRQLFRCDEDQHSQVDAEVPRQCPVQKAEPRCSHADSVTLPGACLRSCGPWHPTSLLSGHQWGSHRATGGWGGEMHVRCIELIEHCATQNASPRPQVAMTHWECCPANQGVLQGTQHPVDVSSKRSVK